MPAYPDHSPDFPAAPGLRLRPLAPGDADGLYAVHTGRAACDEVDPFSPLEDMPSLKGMRREVEQSLADQQQEMWRVAEVNGQIAGYSQMESWLEEDGRWVYLIMGWVLPEWRGRGIGSALLEWGEQTARRMAESEHPGQPWELAANASSTERDSTALLEEAGYVSGYTVLEMDLERQVALPELPLSEGIQVRPVLPEQLPLLAASVNECYQNEYDENRYLEHFDVDEYIASLSDPAQDPGLWQVAWDGAQIAGQVMTKIRPDRSAEVFEVSVRPAWRRKGLARALLARALRELRGRGVEVIRLNTVAEFRTRAMDMYGSVGFRMLKEFLRYRKTPAKQGAG